MQDGHHDCSSLPHVRHAHPSIRLCGPTNTQLSCWDGVNLDSPDHMVRDVPSRTEYETYTDFVYPHLRHT